MTPIRLLPEAKEELRAAARYDESEQAGLGSALLREVRRACERIIEQPRASRIARRVQEILVIAVCHRRRRPGFWTSRA